MISKARKFAATSVLAAAGVLALGAFGSTAAMAAPSAPAAVPAVTGAAHLDPRCDCIPGPAPRPQPPAPEQPAPEQPAPGQPAPEQPGPSEPGSPSGPGTGPSEPSTPNLGTANCPAIVPSHPTGADYVNAWNQSGMCLGAGAAGLVSSAWAGAIPSIIQGAAGSVRSDEAGTSAKADKPANAGSHQRATAPKATKSSHSTASTAAVAKSTVAKSTKDRTASARDGEGLTAPVVVPSHPTGADYVNAWNKSGALLGAGAAGLVSSAWAGAIPSIVQGAAGSLG